MNIAVSWSLLENLLKIHQQYQDGSLQGWSPVQVSGELQEAVKFLASSGMSQFLQEWLLETVFQDLSKHVKPTFWRHFDGVTGDTRHNQVIFGCAVDYLHAVYTGQYLVALRRLRWLQMLANSAPTLAEPSHSAFTPVRTVAPVKGLNFGPLIDKKGLSASFDGVKVERPKPEPGAHSVTFEEGTKYQTQEFGECSFASVGNSRLLDGSYINEKQYAEHWIWSGNSFHNVSAVSDKGGGDTSRNDVFKTEKGTEDEEEDPDYFIRSPIGGYKQQEADKSNDHKTPVNPLVRKCILPMSAGQVSLEEKGSVGLLGHSRLTSTPGFALTAQIPGITPIMSKDSPEMADNTMEVKGEEEDISVDMTSLQIEAASKESSSGDQLCEPLPTAAEVFGVSVPSRPVPGGSVRCVRSTQIQTQAAVKNKVTVMMKAVLFNIFPPNFIKAVRDFYTEAFNAHKRDMEMSDSELEALPGHGRHNEINVKLDDMGLMELLSGSAVTEIVNQQIEQHVQEECKGNFDTHFIVELEEWLDNNILCWLQQLYAGRQTTAQLAAVDAFRDRLRHNIYETYAKSLISQFFDIIIDYPDSKPAILDLGECLQKTDLRSELVSSLRSAIENRLLHPGVNTADIITAYIAAIKSLRLLEPAGVILELVCEPVSRYLRSREDTVRCIVASLTDEGNNELVNELVKTKPAEEEDEEEESSANWDKWMPDPVDADPSAASKLRRSADILSMLVNIYGSKELCFNEYRALLAERILSQDYCDVERELRYLELLKLRFGEAPLHFCEVMLRDVTESRRVNSRIQDARRANPTGNDVDMNAMILSAQFWPAFRDEKVKLPPEMQEHLDKYTKDFETQKQNRTLVWKPHLGTMNIELELKDETMNFSVSPVQAAIIMKFQTKTIWSVDELCSELEMTPTVLRRKIAFWQGQGLLRETSTDVYQLVEERRGRPHDLIMVDEEEAESAMASMQQQKEEEMQVFWTYIQGMLANLQCLTLERIHAMLRMFAMEEPGSLEVSLQELKTFLDNKVKDQLLIFCEGVYRLNK